MAPEKAIQLANEFFKKQHSSGQIEMLAEFFDWTIGNSAFDKEEVKLLASVVKAYMSMVTSDPKLIPILTKLQKASK